MIRDIEIRIEGYISELCSSILSYTQFRPSAFRRKIKGFEEMGKDLERLREEKSLISARLTGFLVWQSILILAFAEMVGQSCFLSQVLSILGLISTLIGLGNFWRLPSKIDALEGRKDKGVRRFIRWMFQGRGLGVDCSIIFAVFWVCAIKWNFFN